MIQLTLEQCKKLIQNRDITTLDIDELIRFFHTEEEIKRFLPEETAAQDPRTLDYIIFNSRRASRPIDYNQTKGKNAPCVICQGKTTGILDFVNLSEGFTFINKNLFPIVYPHNLNSMKTQARGFHFLQWTSSIHENDWLNMPINDLNLVVKRMSEIEGYLLSNKGKFFPETENGYVSIIKNYGSKVGGSLSHDHQQIGFSNLMPRRVSDNLKFNSKKKQVFTEFLLKENPRNLIIKDYGPVILIVPFYMQRPLYMTLVIKDGHKQFLHELSEDELQAVTIGWIDAIYVINKLMAKLGKDIAYNVTTNTQSGVYFEFLPYTQEFGGFEHLGLYSCQMSPDQAAELIQRTLNDRSIAQ